MENYVTAKDIAERLFRRKPHWPRKPDISLQGEENTFGKLIFDFSDETFIVEVVMGIYIKDQHHIINEARKAIKPEFFQKTIEEFVDIWWKKR